MSRNAREIDLDPRSYVGLSFPLRADSNNNFQMTKNSLEQSRHNLRNLLLTYPGERAGNPTFGSRLREVCFEIIEVFIQIIDRFYRVFLHTCSSH